MMSTEAPQATRRFPIHNGNRFLFNTGLTLFACGMILALAAHSALPTGLNVVNGTQGIIYAIGYQLILYGLFTLAYSYLRPTPQPLIFTEPSHEKSSSLR